MLFFVSNATTEILRSYLKFKRKNLGYLSPIILEVEFAALTRILEVERGPYFYFIYQTEYSLFSVS